MLSEHDLFEGCMKATKGGTPPVPIKTFERSWRALLSWLRTQVAKGHGGSVQGLGKVVWATTAAGGAPAPCFVLSERFIHLQLQLGPGVTRAASLGQPLGACEELNCAKLALSCGLTRDQVSTCIRATLHHLADVVQQGQAVQLDLGAGRLTIRSGRADFSFRPGLMQAAAGAAAAGAAAAAGGVAPGTTPLTVEAVQQLTATLGPSGWTTPTGSTVSRASGASRPAAASEHGSILSRHSRATTATAATSRPTTCGGAVAAAPAAAVAAAAAATVAARPSGPLAPGALLQGETHAAALARMAAAAAKAAGEGRAAAKANARAKPAKCVVPGGGPDDAPEPRMRQGKGRAPGTGTLVPAGDGGSSSQAAQQQQQQHQHQQHQQQDQQQQAAALARPATCVVLEAAEAREAAHHQQLLAREEAVLLGLAKRKAALDKAAAATMAEQRAKQKQLAADLAHQIKSRQEAAVAAKTGTPTAEDEAPLVTGRLDLPSDLTARRHQHQATYRAELERQMQAKEQVRLRTAAAERALDQQRLAAAQEELVQTVQHTKELAKRKQQLFKAQLDQQLRIQAACGGGSP